jgi:hypothetical protein
VIKGRKMDTLQKVWEEVLQSECEFQKIGALLIKRKMKERGINLSPTQTSCIEDALANNKLNSFQKSRYRIHY